MSNIHNLSTIPGSFVDNSLDTESFNDKSSDTSVPQDLYQESPQLENGFSTENEENHVRRMATNASFSSVEEQDRIAEVLTRSSFGGLVKRTTTAPLPTMGGGRDYPPLLPDRDQYRVDFDGPDDPLHPFNWPFKKKVTFCAMLAFTSFTATWGSAIFSGAVTHISKIYHVAPVVAVLGISFYVFGFASGPCVWAPLSEMYGRKLPIIVSMFGATVFNFGVATGKDLQTILICRFFAGFFAAGPLAVVGAAFSDVFNAKHRGIAIALFAATVFIGPLIAPIVGNFISSSYLGWRWTQYITGIMSGASLAACICFMEETYHPIILVNKASELRKRTGNWGIYAKHEEFEMDLGSIVKNNLSRPIKMLFTETIILLLSIYTAFIYGILYLFLQAYPIVFVEGYGMSMSVGSLPYMGLMIGMLLGVVMILSFEPYYHRQLALNGGKPVPEARLPPMIIGAIAFPIGLFWFTWTGHYHKSIHWIVPTLSGLFSGFGLICIFLPAINYLIDSYLFVAASAIAANTMLRSAFGGAFPIFAGFMFHDMGVNWAGLLVGLVGTVLAPVPIFFYLYGKKIRQKSKLAFDL
ncbi:MFS general substrate transporter [Nadsonia fulvescens var. elongata DSM 6958]|uniref:MFS general substrate transporter n=1 Tax=Nadsonia fulvescens var. elongata DSM 6958 TaxID=857566 RepID=A0A1E3PPH0_9ASCO|nr:MFS general substrate transporter [Nadsonia fulvescens var. elongata DSM 6958]